MVRIARTVALAPVPRPWLVDALGALTDLAESTTAEDGRVLLPDGWQVPELRLTEGRHLRPGALYESTEGAGAGKGGADALEGEAATSPGSDTVRITVEEWRRTHALRVAFSGSGSDGDLTGRAALFGPDRPDRVELSGRAALRGVRSPLSRFDADAQLRCGDWWQAADGDAGVRRPPLRARLTCGVARAGLTAVPRPGADHGDWDVTVTVRVRGRGPLRPLVSLGLALARRPLARAVAEAVDDAARDWNAQVPQLTALGPEELRRELLTKL
ncbi:hypothetical protein ACFY4H_02710 [Streptomyces althioticus]|uniref:hypothetical protein n=1 Tax=Streptomyces althioticus TaxID=83380 RepID=UPI0036CE77C5